MKKNRKALEVEQNYPDEEQLEHEEEDDLFATSSSSSTPSIRDPSAQLQPLLAQINEILALPTEERRREFSHVKVGVLRRIVQLYPAEEIEGLRGMLRQWRTLGGRVTRKTAEEIIGESTRSSVSRESGWKLKKGRPVVPFEQAGTSCRAHQ